MKHIVLTTSSSGLDNYNIDTRIELIRLRIFVNNVEFIDGLNITNTRLTQLMQGATHSPVHTSPAPADEVKAMFLDLKARGYTDVFITTLSSALSESYNIISSVAEDFKDSLNIHVYDTKDINLCEAILALEAEYMLDKGEDRAKVIDRLDALRASHKILFTIGDLTNLIRNKKLSTTSGFFANLFDIKPVLTVTDAGLLVPQKKIRKLDKALQYMIDELGDVVPRADSFAYTVSTGLTELDAQFSEMLKQQTRTQQLPMLPVCSISLANHGPTGIALAVFNGEIPHVSHYFV